MRSFLVVLCAASFASAQPTQKELDRGHLGFKLGDNLEQSDRAAKSAGLTLLSEGVESTVQHAGYPRLYWDSLGTNAVSVSVNSNDGRIGVIEVKYAAVVYVHKRATQALAKGNWRFETMLQELRKRFGKEVRLSEKPERVLFRVGGEQGKVQTNGRFQQAYWCDGNTMVLLSSVVYTKSLRELSVFYEDESGIGSVTFKIDGKPFTCGGGRRPEDWEKINQEKK